MAAKIVVLINDDGTTGFGIDGQADLLRIVGALNAAAAKISLDIYAPQPKVVPVHGAALRHLNGGADAKP